MRKTLITLAALFALQVLSSGCVLVDHDRDRDRSHYRHEEHEEHEEHERHGGDND